MANTDVNGIMGTYHLADNPGTFQPTRTNNFRFIVQGLDKLLRVGGDEANSADYIQNVPEIIDFSVVSFTAPHFTQDDIPIKRGNSTVYFAGTPTFNEGSLVINDFYGADGKSVLEAWQNLSYNVIDDTIPDSDKYKVNAMVLEYTPDNRLLKYWEVKGCWVKSLSETDWNNDSPGKKQVTASIRFDRAIPHYSSMEA